MEHRICSSTMGNAPCQRSLYQGPKGGFFLDVSFFFPNSSHFTATTVNLNENVA